MTDPALEAEEEMQRLLAAARQSLVDRDLFTVNNKTHEPDRVIAILEPFVSEARRARIDAVLAERTYTVATVVEGLVNTGNVSAVMRTAEALGFQAFHVITHGDHTDGIRYKSSERASQGAEKWLDLWQWATPTACVAHLKEQDYQIVATHLDHRARPIDAFDFTRKTALVFGNERDGVTPDLLALADHTCIVPISGFSQSFNISVAAAVSLYHARHDRLTRQGYHGDLGDAQRDALKALYYLKSVRRAREILDTTSAES